MAGYFTAYYFGDDYFRYLAGTDAGAITGAIIVTPSLSIPAIAGNLEFVAEIGWSSPVFQRLPLCVAVVGSIDISMSVSMSAMIGSLDSLAAVRIDDEEWFLLQEAA